MSEDISPDQAAAKALGDQADDYTDDLPAPSPSSESDGMLARLFDGDADGPSVGELRRQYDIPQWAAILGRGVMRVATGAGVPPLVEIVMGAVMGLAQADRDSLPAPDDGGGVEQDGDEPIPDDRLDFAEDG